jgi:hypothetical protein
MKALPAFVVGVLAVGGAPRASAQKSEPLPYTRAAIGLNCRGMRSTISTPGSGLR